MVYQNSLSRRPWLLGTALICLACNRSPDPGLTSDDGTTTGTDTTGDSTSPSDTTGADTTEGGPRPPYYDVGVIPDTPPPMGCAGGGGGGAGQPAFSYIWIANSGQGTVSKIETTTLTEVGRYLTREDGQGDPSRTSVNLNGDVAVANRNGGLAKFYANPAHCEDRNGDGAITTSTGPDDILPWDEEECRAWSVPFDYSSQRPVAWAPGDWDPEDCRYENVKVWTAGANDDGWGKKFPGEPPPDGGDGGDAGDGGDGEPPPDGGDDGEPMPPPGGGDGSGPNSIEVVLLDGDTGMIEEIIPIPEMIADYYGIYGGAVDAAGNFWGSQLGIGHIVRVNLSDLEYRLWPMAVSGYGMTVDSQGYVWTCDYQVGRFDPVTETWQTAATGGSGGCMEDGKGTLWQAGNGLTGVDAETLDVIANLPVPAGGFGGAGYVHGVSIDFQGYVWGVGMWDGQAHRVDPGTGDVETYPGLTEPYTYSDMTGFALANAGGWVPAG